MNALLWLVAAALLVIGITQVVQGDEPTGTLLLVLAVVVGPVGVSLYDRP